MAAERRRSRRLRLVQFWVHVVFAAAIIALGIAMAIEYESQKQLARQAGAIQKGVDSLNAALSQNMKTIEHNERTLEEGELVLTRATAGLRASVLLRAVDGYVSYLEATGKLQFNDRTEEAEFSRNMKLRIRPSIVSDIEASPEITDAQVRRRIEQLVDANLDMEQRK